MWNTFSHYFARVLTWAWFAGAVLMIITIPACAIKIFSALWEDPEEDAPIPDKAGKQNPV
jgi:hypothetical protein